MFLVIKTHLFQAGMALGFMFAAWIFFGAHVMKEKIRQLKLRYLNEAKIAARAEIEPLLQAAGQGRAAAEEKSMRCMVKLEWCEELNADLRNNLSAAEEENTRTENEIAILTQALAEARAESEMTRVKLADAIAVNELASVASQYG